MSVCVASGTRAAGAGAAKHTRLLRWEGGMYTCVSDTSRFESVRGVRQGTVDRRGADLRKTNFGTPGGRPCATRNFVPPLQNLCAGRCVSRTSCTPLYAVLLVAFLKKFDEICLIFDDSGMLCRLRLTPYPVGRLIRPWQTRCARFLGCWGALRSSKLRSKSQVAF